MSSRNQSSGSTGNDAAVPLNRGAGAASASADKGNTVWSLHPPAAETSSARSASPSRHQEREEQLQEILGDVQPLAKKCGMGERGTCCKDLKGEDERHLISPEIVRDV